jgi:hypothetical protein
VRDTTRRTGPHLALAAFIFLQASLSANAIGPEAQRMIAIDKSLAGERCQKSRDYTELIIASGFGNAARAAEIQKRFEAPRTPERQALAKERNAMNSGSIKFSEEDTQAISESRSRLESFCPYVKEGVPLPLPPVKDEAMARDFVVALAPRALAKMRQCEMFYPERQGSLERAWAASSLSKLDIAELRAAADEVRAWMKNGFGTPAPGSKLAQDLKDPEKSRMQAMICEMAWGDLQRIEAALPAGFVAKYRR